MPEVEIHKIKITKLIILILKACLYPCLIQKTQLNT